MLKSFSTSSQVVLTANPTYWGAKPKFSQVILRNVLPATQLLDVQRGTNEIALDLSPDQAKALGELGQGRGDAVAERVLPVRELQPEGLGDQLQPAHPERDPLRARLLRPRLARRRGRRAGRRRRAVDVPRRAQPGSGDKNDLAKAKAEVTASGINNPTVNLEYPSDFSSNGLDFGVARPEGAESDLGKIGITVNLKGSPVADVARAPTARGPSSWASGTGARTTRTRTTTSRSCPARRSACAPAGRRARTAPSRRSARRRRRWSRPSSAARRSSRSRTP